MSSPYPSVLEINLGALAHNYHFIKSKLAKNTKLLGVVKANGYGSESLAIAKRLEVLGIDYLAVAYIKEGVLLRTHGVKTPILVLHPQAPQFSEMIAHHLEPSLYSLRALSAFAAAAKDCQNYPLHIKTNTGLNRLGFSENDFEAALEILKNTPQIQIKGLLSHLAASDELSESSFTKNQIKRFKDHITVFENSLGQLPLKHLLNTSGILNFPEAQFEMARSGIGLYGYSNNPEIDKELRPVASLKCNISQIHAIKAGDWVGYNKGFVAHEDMKIATLTIGHADGISRQYGHGKGVVYIQGKAAPIVGNVCMDMIMVRLPEMEPNEEVIKEGDQIVVFGQGEQSNATRFAAGAQSISYELLTSIGPRVHRQIIE